MESPRGCPIFRIDEEVKLKRKTTEQFIQEAIQIWGDRWDYSRTEYVNASTSLLISCRAHGDFTQAPHSHLRGSVGCSECASNKQTSETILQEFREVWGDRWDYSKTQYKSGRLKVTIVCPVHGEFDQLPSSHKSGKVGCPGCNGRGITTAEFIAASKEVWGNRWDYSNTEYTDSGTPVTITCLIHGDFSQLPWSHRNGQVSCPGCLKMRKTTEQFISEAKDVWGDALWDYSSAEYAGFYEPVRLSCSEHGDFTQVAEYHLRGVVGCIKCRNLNVSTAEKELQEWLQSLIHIETNVRTLLPSGSEVDIYVPSSNVAIEFNGIYYHSSKFKDSKYHYRKFQEASRVGVRLIQVWEDDWILRKSIVKEHILQVLHLSQLPKVAARQTEVVEITNRDAFEFLNQYHIQGQAPGSVYLGLLFKSSLVAVAVFKRRATDYELVRYATSANVQGGHSKIISYVERNYTYNNLITFADLTFGAGDLYRKTGWDEDCVLPPDYKYLYRGQLHHKFNFRLKRFRKDPSLKYLEGLTEFQLAQLNHLYRVYDSGKIRFIKPKPHK